MRRALQPVRLLCWLAKHNYSMPVMQFGSATLDCSPSLAACKPLEINLSRPKRASLRRPRESSELRREGFWCGQWQRGSPARRAPDAWGDGWLHASELHGLFATSWHGNFTRSSKLPEPCHSEHRGWRSSTKSLTTLQYATRIALARKPTCASQRTLCHYLTRSAACIFDARITLSDSSL